MSYEMVAVQTIPLFLGFETETLSHRPQPTLFSTPANTFYSNVSPKNLPRNTSYTQDAFRTRSGYQPYSQQEAQEEGCRARRGRHRIQEQARCRQEGTRGTCQDGRKGQGPAQHGIAGHQKVWQEISAGLDLRSERRTIWA